jgi:hypothetical protein
VGGEGTQGVGEGGRVFGYKIREEKTSKDKEKDFSSLIVTLKDWNDCQPAPLSGFVPENIVNKHGVEKVQKLVTQWGKENGGFQKFLGALKA